LTDITKLIKPFKACWRDFMTKSEISAHEITNNLIMKTPIKKRFLEWRCTFLWY